MTRRGEVTYPALVVDTIREDTAFVPYHWASPVAANLLTVDALDPTSRIPEYKVCACRLEKGTEITKTPAPPVEPGKRPYDDELGPIDDDRPPTVPQGRGTAEG